MALIGNEILYVQGLDATGFPAATTQQTTTGAIAALAGELSSDTNTNITTVGAGTLTAAGLVGGLITRSGPVAAFTDTTATAALIYAAVGSIFGYSFYTEIKNTTAFTQTIAAGSGVTLPTAVVVPPNSVAGYLVSVVSATAVTFYHVRTSLLSNNTPEIITTLSTVGAGTVTAAAIAGGVTSRTGSQSNTPFTDTTGTADDIIAAQANARIGATWEYTYSNNTNATATLTGGAGVTVSGITSIPANTTARYLVTYTAASTLTMVGFSAGSAVSSFVPQAKVVTAQTDVTSSTTLTDITGLSVPLLAGATYAIRCYLPVTATATPGAKFALASDGTLTATSFSCAGTLYNATTPAASSVTTTLGAAVASVAGAGTYAVLDATIVVNAAGSIRAQIAQNTSNGTATSALVNGNMIVTRIA